MITNEDGITIIKDFEGWRSNPYLDVAGVPTIGYGSTWDLQGDRVTMQHPSISEEEGEKLLRRELAHARGAISKLVRVPLSQDQFSALVSLTYNIGSGALQRSTLRMALNNGDYYDTADEFPKWRMAGGQIMSGLIRRRGIERALFLQGTD